VTDIVNNKILVDDSGKDDTAALSKRLEADLPDHEPRCIISGPLFLVLGDARLVLRILVPRLFLLKSQLESA
jgi:hypothetical protein